MALVLTVALGFSVISISVKGSGKNSGQVTTKSIKKSSKFTDGLPKEDLFKYETKISKAGTYRITLDPTISTKTFAVGSEVYDCDGKLLGAFVLFNGEQVKAEYKYKEGTCSFLFRYLTTEEDLRDFIEEYEASYNAKSIREAVKKVKFDKFNENGTASFSCNVSIGKASASKYDVADLLVMTGISISLIAVTVILGALYKQKKPAEPEVYDGTAPVIPETPSVKQNAKTTAQPAQYGYPQAPYQNSSSSVWVCHACGANSNVGRFCANCGQPHIFAPQVTYQAPAYQLPAYTVPVQQYPAPVTYQMPVQYGYPGQPVQYVQPGFVPAPVQQYPVPAQQIYAPMPQQVFVPAPVAAPAPAPKPDYSLKPKKPEPEPADPEFVNGLKNRIPAVGARYAAFCVVFLFIQLAGAMLLTLFAPDFVRQYKTALSYGLIVLAVDLIGFPFIWLLMSSIPKVKIEQHSLSFSKWFGFLMMTEALMLAGSLIGNPIHTALTQPFNGGSLNKASELMQDANVFIRTLVVGIGAPVFEELIFRKVLIDRTIKYGEYVSIVMSGIMFGLLHGNFSQFFFAALVGMLFAYVYIRTGRIRYTIFLHMAVNLSSALVLQTLLTKVLKSREDGDYDAIAVLCALIMLAWVGGMFAIGIIGLVRLIKGLKRKKLALNMMKGEPTHKEVRKYLLSDKALWVYLAMTILLFLHSYLPNIILFFMNKVS